MMPAALRAPDGTTWSSYTSTAGHLMLRPVAQDPDTGQWHTARGVPDREVTEEELATYEPIAPEPLRDPRITRLAALVDALLSEHERATGQPAAAAPDISAALTAVAAIPEEARWRRVHAASQAARIAFHRGARA